jgi:5'-phosphate synthase pdxT subunit
MLIGILAIQGSFAAHANCLKKLNVAYRYVKSVQQLQDCDALIIPGGESTTILKFITSNGLFDAILQMAAQNKPIFGTCAGAILLAKKIVNSDQPTFDLIDMTIERNAYGRQLDSIIQHGTTSLSDQPQEMVFIRAPKIHAIGKNVQVIGKYNNEIVCVRQNNCLATTFHPELSANTLWHEYFLSFFNTSF